MIIRFRFFHSKFAALSIWPFIFVKDTIYKQDKILINHEKIHLRQQIEMLWIPFFIWYILEFIIKWVVYKDRNVAYKAISFEREAYENELNFDYLKNRKPWSFWKHI